MGRNKLEVDFKVLDALLQRGASLHSCSAILEVSPDTIERRIKEAYDFTFAEYKENRFEKTKLKLIETAIDMALAKNVTMLIFCLKNIAGWSDKNEITEKEKQVVVKLHDYVEKSNKKNENK